MATALSDHGSEAVAEVFAGGSGPWKRKLGRGLLPNPSDYHVVNQPKMKEGSILPRPGRMEAAECGGMRRGSFDLGRGFADGQ